jgi:DNA invertase Pin-like site-specific DNA recombinase
MNGVIYCRVSSKEQVEGTSLESQELACREYANRNRMDILKVFVERGESAKFADRTQLLELLAFCRHRENAVQSLLVWKVDRLARNVGDHFNIKASLKKQGVQVVSVTEPIDANPEGKLMETILAGFAQFDNDLRAARTLQGMRRKIQEGIFPWKPPFGYKTATRKGDKKTAPDVPDQPLFGLLQRAWREFATGKHTKEEIRRLMTGWGVQTRRGVPMPRQSLDKMFRDRFYAGIIGDPWSGEEHLGQHVPLVSREMFAAVQTVIDRRSRSIRHQSIRPEFPMRMFARCSECDHYVTGSFSRGHSQYYPYYRCPVRNCPKRTNQRVHVVHAEFLEFLKSVTPGRSDIQKVFAGVAEAAGKRMHTARVLRERRDREAQRLKLQHQELIQMKMETLLTNEEFMQQKALLMKRLYEVESALAGDPVDENDIAPLVDEICDPLMNLSATWMDFPPPLKPRFQHLLLPQGFAVSRIGTAQMGRLFSTFRQSEHPDANEVALSGERWNQIAQDIKEFVHLLRLAHDAPVAAAHGKELAV